MLQIFLPAINVLKAALILSVSSDNRLYAQTSSPPLQLDRAAQNIMLVDRGPTDSSASACKFTEKVWHAQNAGAVAVLVVNYDDSHTTMVSLSHGLRFSLGAEDMCHFDTSIDRSRRLPPPHLL